jgi:hypothetical protein
VAVVGNSFAVQLIPLLREWYRNRPVRIILASRTECLGLSSNPVSGQRDSDPCVAWTQAVDSRLLAMPHLAAVVFASYPKSAWFLTGQRDAGRAARRDAALNVVRTLSLLKAHGIATLVVKHPPGPRASPVPECIARSRDRDDPCTLPRLPLTREDLLASVARRHPGLTGYVSLDRYFCGPRRCHTVIGGVVAYLDEQHITATFARTLAPYVGPRIDAAIRHAR